MQKLGLQLNHFKSQNILAGVGAFAIVVAASVLFVERPAFKNAEFAFYAATFWVLLVVCLVPPLLQLARAGYKAVRSVCYWSAGLLVVTLGVFHVAYLSVAANSQIPSIEKLLNLPPLIAAIWAATMGWYVHFQATLKNQRTANAFAIVMQMRTNAELVANQKHLLTFCSAADPLSVEDERYFTPNAAMQIRQSIEIMEDADPKNFELLHAARRELGRAESVVAIMYLLNFYEFVAVGIKFGDLDDALLYETIAPHVVSVYARADCYIDHIQKKAASPQVLAFEHLAELVKRWKASLNDDEARVKNLRGK